ncbi:MAG: hypothetical protein ISS23_01160 [Nanoarchaeota archaeon]|nr:hypothetical protein [Nanoarchaeota archaeon]
MLNSTTLMGDEVFVYLNFLENQLSSIIPDDNFSLHYVLHSQMKNMISTYKSFLEITDPVKPTILELSPKGMPLLQSFKPDLKQLCKLVEETSEISEEHPAFQKLAQSYKKDINYEIDKDQYIEIIDKISQAKLQEINSRGEPTSEMGFAINETEDHIFEFMLNEQIFLRGYDQKSREFPILIRKGKARYYLEWNILISEICEDKIYMPYNKKPKEEKPLEKEFSSITKTFHLKKSDYKEVKLHFKFESHGPKDYSEFIAAGTEQRVTITKNILNILSKLFKQKIIIEELKESYLEKILNFEKIPFRNAPELIPHSSDLSRSPIPTWFDLISSESEQKIGRIDYSLPYKYETGAVDNRKTRFKTDSITVSIFGEAIQDYAQFLEIQKELKNK